MHAALADLRAEVLLRPEGPGVTCVPLTLRAAEQEAPPQGDKTSKIRKHTSTILLIFYSNLL